MAAVVMELSQDSSWSIVFVSFMAQLLAYGSPQAVGVLYPEWFRTFQEGKGTTAWVGSTASGVGLIASPLLSACVDHFGARPVTVFSGVLVAGGLMLSAFAPNVSFLVFSFGIGVGMGCGLVYAATLTIICQYFDKRRGLALGVATTGISVGGFVYATMQNKLIEEFGVDGCLLIVGALALNLIACAGPMRPLYLPGYYLKQRAALNSADETLYNKEPGTEQDGPSRARSTLETVIRKRLRFHAPYLHGMCECLQKRPFAALCVSFFLFGLGAFPPVLFMEDVAQSQGLLEHVTTIPLVSIAAAANGVGKLALGILADAPWVNSLHLYAMTVAASGSALLLVPISKSYAGLQALSAALGFFSGNWSITSYITSRLVGIEHLGQAHGLLMCFGGFGIMLGPPVVGWFFDWTQSYDMAFYVSGGCVLVGGAVVFLAALRRWESSEKVKSKSVSDVKTLSECDKATSVA